MKTLALLGNIFIAICYAFIKKFMKRPRKSIKGEVALVTGAGHGLGREIAVKMAALGATVVIVDINETGNKETAQMIEEKGGKVYDVTCDLSKLENIKRLGKEVREEVGDVTILVNNAAIVYVTDLLSRTDEMISKTFQVNILAHFRTIKEFLPSMKRKNHGHIIAVSSQAGFLGVGYLGDYCSTKHAILGLMDSVRRELRWEGISGVKTTAACPSWIDTGFAKNPKTGSKTLCPILTQEYVADEIVKAFLAEEPNIAIPSATSFFLLKATFPDSVIELIVDYIKPLCEKTN